MKQIEPYSEEQTLVALAGVREVLAAVENTWKQKRAESRELTVRLVVEHRYSVAEAARLSGHHRTTISTWLDIYNAEHKKGPAK